MADVTIAVELREGRGKEFNRKLRRAGRIPAIVYGHGSDPVALSVDPTVLERELRASHAGINTLFDLEGEASVAGRMVLVKELQREPIRGGLVHADFIEIEATETIHVSVPIHLIGDAPGVVMGGVIEHVLRELELACLPGAIPDEIIADVSTLDVGHSLHVNDLALPGGVELLTDETLSVVSVILPKVAEEAVEPEEGDEAADEEDGEAKAEKADDDSGAAGDADASSEGGKD